MRPHRWQPTRLHRPWDSPGKNTGVGCHFLLQGMKVKSESEVAQSCLTLRDPMDYSLPGSSVHRIFQARVLEWGAIAFSKISSYNHINSYFPLFLIQNIDAICTVPYLAFFTYLYIQKIVSYQYLETLLTIFVAVCTSLCAQTMVYSPIPLLLNTGCLQTLHVTHNLLPMAFDTPFYPLFYTHTPL